MSFKDFVKDCENLECSEIHSMFIKDNHRIKELRKKNSEEIKILGGIFYNPNLISTYKKNDVVIIQMLPILLKMPFEQVREFLQENFPEEL